MQKLQIAVAGAGRIGRTHIALIQASNECALSGILDPAATAAAVAAPAPAFRFTPRSPSFSGRNTRTA